MSITPFHGMIFGFFVLCIGCVLVCIYAFSSAPDPSDPEFTKKTQQRFDIQWASLPLAFIGLFIMVVCGIKWSYTLDTSTSQSTSQSTPVGFGRRKRRNSFINRFIKFLSK